MMRLLWEPRAWEEYCSWQRDKKTLKKINELLKEIQRTPYDGKGKPEALKGNYSGWWSRRINEADRIIYRQYDDDTVVIAACKTHYDA